MLRDLLIHATVVAYGQSGVLMLRDLLFYATISGIMMDNLMFYCCVDVNIFYATLQESVFVISHFEIIFLQLLNSLPMWNPIFSLMC